jgi:hypothetical protein
MNSSLQYRPRGGGLELDQGGGLVADLLQVGEARKLDHPRRAAHGDDRVGAGRQQVVAQHLLVDVAGAVGPALGDTPVAGVVEVEDVGALGRQRLQLLAQQDVGLGLVGVDQGDLGVCECWWWGGWVVVDDWWWAFDPTTESTKGQGRSASCKLQLQTASSVNHAAAESQPATGTDACAPLTLVVSSLSLQIARITCQQGVMPVPPAMRLMRLAWAAKCLVVDEA